jgi:hypothetical protein
MAMKSKGVIIGLLTLGVLVVVCLYLYAQAFVPSQKLRDTEWLTTASQEEARDTQPTK